MTKSKSVIAWMILLGIIITIVESGAYASYKLIILPRASFLVYRAATISRADYDAYLETRNEAVGWPANRADIRSRNTPALPAAVGDCISTYGDSFVFASEVKDEEAWGNLVSAELGCRVGNYGVGGYGTDQAYLRFQMNDQDAAPITILGLYPQNIMRNVNQYRHLLTGQAVFGFKPRFILRDGELELIKTPAIAVSDLDNFFRDPGVFLEHEAFLPDSTYGPARMTFPYSISLIHLMLNERVVNWLADKPSWIDFWKPAHPTQSLEITVKIVERFQQTCVEREKQCMVIIFPTPASYNDYVATGELASQFLAAELESQNIAILDLTEGFATQLGEADYCALLTVPQECQGHFNDEGNKLVAEILIAYLSQSNLTPVSN